MASKTWKTRLSAVTVACYAMVYLTMADYSITVLHTNDVHARIEESDKNGAPCNSALRSAGKCFGGVARIRTMVNKKRAEHKNTILLDAGDQFQGTLWFYKFGGLVSAEFMNLIGYTAMAVGNHEFDKGVSGLAPFAKKLKFPLLSSNMQLENTPELRELIKRSTVVTIGGQRIGVIGYTTHETAFLSLPGTVTFIDEVQAIQAEVDQMISQGVNKIIAVGHSGYSYDVDMARHLTNVDIVVGGHTNSFLYNGTSPSSEQIEGNYPTVITSPSGETVLVVQDYAFGKYLGELNVIFDDAGKVKSWTGNPILLDKSVEQEKTAAAIVAKYVPQIEALKQAEVGETYVSLLADRVLCRTTECNLGNLITDAIVYYNLRHTNKSWSEVGMAIVNAGSFRASINIGKISTENIVYLQPFRNEVDMIQVTGQTILDIFEYCATKWTDKLDDAFGGFLQVSGMQVTYNLAKPVGQRVHEILVTCTECDVPRLEPMVLDRKYNLLSSAYLINGGDGFSMIPKGIINRLPLGQLDTDIILAYVKKFSPLTTGLEGRIRHLADIIDAKYCPGQ